MVPLPHSLHKNTPSLTHFARPLTSSRCLPARLLEGGCAEVQTHMNNMLYKTRLIFVCLIWHTIIMHAQGPIDCTNMAVPKHFGILVAYDQDCVQQLGGEAAARADIKLKMDAAVDALNAAFQVFNLEFEVILFSNKQYSNELTHAQVAVKMEEDFFCVPYNGTVFFQGYTAGGEAQGQTAIINAGSSSANLIIHEIGHMIFGAGHVDFEPLCMAACAGNFMTNNFMCEEGINLTLTTCQVNFLNDVFFANGCPALMRDIEPLPDDFECFETPTFSFSVDKKYLIRDCDENRSDLMCNLTLTGGSVPASITSVTARFQDHIYDFDLPTMGLDFNAVADIPGGNQSKELRQLIDPTGPVNGPRQVFTLQPGETKVFMFKLHFNPDDPTVFIASPNATTIFADVVATITPPNLPPSTGLLTRNAVPRPILPVNPSGGFTPVNEPVIVTGELVLPVTSSGTFTWNAPLTLVKPGGSIRVPSGMDLRMLPANFITIEGCGGLWRGIRVDPNGSANLDKVTIRDAVNAVDVRPQAKAVNIINTVFENNEVGINIEGITTTTPTLSGLTFKQTAPLKAKPTAQNPNPNTQSLLGIKATNAGDLSISKHALLGFGAKFESLRDGILANTTNMDVSDAVFAHLVPAGTGSGGTGVRSNNGSLRVTNSAFMDNKTGIRAYKGTLTASGNYFTDMLDTAISVNRASILLGNNTIDNAKGGLICKSGTGVAKGNTMTNVSKGIYATGSALTVEENNISKAKVGIEGVLNGGFVARKNIIAASDYGIFFYHGNQFYGVPKIEENTITMAGNLNGVGIATVGSAAFPNSGGYIYNNTIEMQKGHAGLAATVAAGLEVVYNHITLPQQSTSRHGIQLEEGDNLTVTDNDVTGAGTHGADGNQRGIYGMHACRSFLACNNTDNTAIGINFAGACVGKGQLTLQHNIMNDHEFGLLLGLANNGNAIIGPQVHRENQWKGAYSGSGALHFGDGFIASLSKFTADDQANDDFIPDMFSPSVWFENLPTENPSYACTRRPGDSDSGLDGRVAQGLVQGVNDGGALQWLAQRRLYERIVTDGIANNDSGLQTFGQLAVSNGMADYAQRQLAMRTLNQATASERTALLDIDAALLAKSAALAQAQAQWADPISTPAQRAQGQAQMAVLQSEIAQKQVEKEQVLSSLTQQRTNHAQQQLSLPTLGGTDIFKANERAVHRIWMEQGLAPDGILTAAQTAALQPIAEQCPLLGGDAVLWARAMLQQQAETPVTYLDEQTCQPTGNRPDERSNALLSEKVDWARVAPNPASDQLHIAYELASGSTFILLDATGRTCARQRLAPGQGQVDIPVAALPNGLYHYHIPGLASGKIIVQH